MKLLSHGPEPCASANSAISAYDDLIFTRRSNRSGANSLIHVCCFIHHINNIRIIAQSRGVCQGLLKNFFIFFLQLSNIWTIFIKKIIQCVLLMCGFAAAAVVFVGSVVKSATFPYYPQIIYIHMTHM